MTPRGHAQPAESEALAPIRAALWAMAARPGAPPVNGLVPGLTMNGPVPANGLAPGSTTPNSANLDRPVQDDRWVPATRLVNGEALDDLVDTAKQRWHASPHAAAALAWKSYTYWLALPAVLGHAAARRVPLLRPEAVVARWSPHQPFVTLGLTSVEVAVLPSDPLAAAGEMAPQGARIRVVQDDDALLAAMRESLKEEHLGPMLASITARLQLGPRTLWGSLASGVAHGVSRAAGVVPGATLTTAIRILTALGVDDLVELAPRADGEPGLDIQRRTCCLAFTLPEPKICTGCCIR